MTKNLYWLSDEEWTAIQPHLPTGRRGARRVDDRRVISGILHMLKSGARWRDCPVEYGPTRRFTIASTGGPSRGSGRMSSTSYQVLPGRLARPAPTVHRSRRTARHRAEKGGVRASHRAIARWTDDQGSCPDRRERAHFFVFGLSHSDDRYVRTYSARCRNGTIKLTAACDLLRR